MKILAILVSLFFASNALAQSHSGHGTGPETTSPPPVKEHKSNTDDARVTIDVPVEQQGKIGLKTARAEKMRIKHTIRTVGTISADQTREAHVHTKINGWIESVHADYVGKPVKKDQPLFDLYSPELVNTQQEYLTARQHGSVGQDIARIARDRLQLWGVPQSEIERLEKTGTVSRAITFNSPADGFIVDKMAVQGMYITPEMELYRIVDLSRLWIIVTLYEQDIAVISEGDEAEITLSYDPGNSFTGRITYIYPEIEEETRTAKARLEMENPDLRLKPGMFADVQIRKDLGEAVVIPDDAVIDTGTRSVVFVKSGPSSFEPREVKTGPRVEGNIVVFSGLEGGEEVVTSAHFLIDAESKFQAAIQKGAPVQGGHGGHSEH